MSNTLWLSRLRACCTDTGFREKLELWFQLHYWRNNIHTGKESEPETNRKSWSTLCPECSSFYAASLQNFIFSFQWLYTTIMWGNHLDPGFTYFISNILGLIFINNCPLAKQIYTSVYKQSYFRYWSWKILIVLGISVCCFFKNQITAMLFEIANI